MKIIKQLLNIKQKNCHTLYFLCYAQRNEQKPAHTPINRTPETVPLMLLCRVTNMTANYSRNLSLIINPLDNVENLHLRMPTKQQVGI